LTTVLSSTDATILANFRTSYDTWVAGHGWGGGDSSLLADPDEDGLCNLIEYALGSDPTLSMSAPYPILGRSGDRLTFTFFRARAELIYTVEASSDLVTWTAINTNPGMLSQQVTVSDISDIQADKRRFLRLRVSQ
jgi:hypothetical protein